MDGSGGVTLFVAASAWRAADVDARHWGLLAEYVEGIAMGVAWLPRSSASSTTTMRGDAAQSAARRRVSFIFAGGEGIAWEGG